MKQWVICYLFRHLSACVLCTSSTFISSLATVLLYVVTSLWIWRPHFHRATTFSAVSLQSSSIGSLQMLKPNRSGGDENVFIQGPHKHYMKLLCHPPFWIHLVHTCNMLCATEGTRVEQRFSFFMAVQDILPSSIIWVIFHCLPFYRQ